MEEEFVPLDCVLVKSDFCYSDIYDRYAFAVYVKSDEFNEEYYEGHIKRYDFLWWNCEPLSYKGESAGELRLNLMALKEWKRKENLKPTPHVVRMILQQERERSLISDDWEFLQSISKYNGEIDPHTEYMLNMYESFDKM